MSPGAAALLLAAAGIAALLADGPGHGRRDRRRAARRLPAGAQGRRRVYLFGALSTGLGVLVLSPFLWSSPEGRVLGRADDPGARTARRDDDELFAAALNAFRLTALGLAFSAYALLLDHDRLVAAAGGARRSALAVALATRLVPSLERDAAGSRSRCAAAVSVWRVLVATRRCSRR